MLSFNACLGLDYFEQENNNKSPCLICSEIVAVMKEQNIKRQYATKDCSIYNKGQV